MNQSKILIVDDNNDLLGIISSNLSGNDFAVVTCQSGEQALRILELDSEINVVLTDLAMDNMNGAELFEKINQLYPYIPVIILTGQGSIESAVKLVKAGAFDYIQKTSDSIQLTKILRLAVRQNSLQREIQLLRQQLDYQKTFCNIVGRSRKMVDLFELINLVCDTGHNILIEGESGTGKELVARALHEKSHRKNNPFVAINCSAIPPTLMESELFGYEPGAFTGALNQKPGKFELANEGTIFLDEISEMDVSLQSKLLRVVEEKKIQRIGGNADIKTNFRLIAATNRELKKDVEKNLFRGDLYYRLNVISIKIPPLRERQEDVLCLIDYFLKRYSVLEKKDIKGISPDALTILCDYKWPGNVRELENVLKRATITCSGNRIETSDLPLELISGVIQAPGVKKENKLKCGERKEDIINALKKTGGNKAKAAKLIGIHRKQLYREINKFNIDCESFKA